MAVAPRLLLILCACLYLPQLVCGELHKPMAEHLAAFRAHGTGTGRLRGTAKPSDFEWKPAVVILAHSRREYLQDTLCSLLELPLVEEFDVVISIDNPPFRREVDATLAECLKGRHLPLSTEVWEFKHGLGGGFQTSALFKIAQHFRFAMDKGFREKGYSHLILLEEDLKVSPDFLHLFKESAWLLHVDHSLWCVSAWNDNGFKSTTVMQKRLFRTDYFPGLGWMLRAQLWLDELADKWPRAASTGWDHWMRLSSISKGRACVVPEVPRTKHIGDKGANVNPQSAQMYHRMAWAQGSVEEGQAGVFGDLFYLLQETYEPLIAQAVAGAQRVSGPSFLQEHLKQAGGSDVTYLITYERPEWERLAPRLSLPRASPRALYKGTTITRYQGAAVILADRRISPYLTGSDSISPNPSATFIAAKQAQSCDSACSGIGKRCAGDHLQWANSCEALAKVYPCEAGCGHQVGQEIPAYVNDPSQVTHHQCLTTDAPTTSCKASHRSTARLCPCV